MIPGTKVVVVVVVVVGWGVAAVLLARGAPLVTWLTYRFMGLLWAGGLI